MKTKFLLALLTWCCCSYMGFAQQGITNHITNGKYSQDTETYNELVENAKALVKTKEGLLTSSQAKKELAEALDKKAPIKLLAPNKVSLTGPEVYKKIRQSAVVFGMVYQNPKNSDTLVSAASGYIIDASGICVTNHHVVEGFAKDGPQHPVTKYAMMVQTNKGKTYAVKKILAASDEKDIAIVQLETHGDKFKPLPLGASAEIGSTVYVLSNPQRKFNYFSKGIVSRNVERSQLGGGALKYEMSITADYATGSSGGPIVDKFGNLVGMVSNTQDLYARPHKREALQMVIKGAVPIAALKMMLTYHN